MSDRIQICAIFPIKERQWLLVHLESFEWDFTSFGEVNVSFPDEKIRMRYIGWGNHEGIPVVTLKPIDSNSQRVQEIAQRYSDCSGTVYLERITE